MRKAVPVKSMKGKKDFAFLPSMASSTPRIKNSRMVNLSRKGDLDMSKKNISPMVSSAVANSRFFLAGMILSSSSTVKDMNSA